MPNPTQPEPEKRVCVACEAPLTGPDAQRLCAACIFRRLATTGSTAPFDEDDRSETGPTTRRAPAEAHDTDFYSEYELLGEIGRGGMGVIYKAHQPELNRIVALKVIHAVRHSGEAVRKRFQAEVKVAARLSHPNLVPIFDVGVMDGCPCFSMEFFSGGTLADRLAQPGTPLDQSVMLLVKVARAVFHAHQHGVLHRDLKPANILLDADGEPHVADFGLAKEMGSDSDLTRSESALGSPNYMSPEQAAGRSNSLTVATDIYSLGVILYQLLTGRLPFLADTPVETMRLVAESEPLRPSAIAASVDRDLETICLKCLEKEPARRYRTADEFADDLERWLRHEPIHARPTTGFERARKWVRRHPGPAALVALVVLAVTGGVTGVFWQWRKAERARHDESTQRLRAESALAHSAIALAESALREGNGPAVQAALATVPKELRDATWTYLLGESDTSRPLPSLGVTRLDDLAADPSRPSVFAAAARAGKIILFDVRDDSRLLEFTPGFTTDFRNAILRVAFSPRGTRIAIGRNGPGGIVVHDARDGRKLAEWGAPRSGQLEFSPDEMAILQTSADRRTTQLWNADDGQPRWSLNSGYHAAAFAADTRYVVSYSWKDNLRLLRATDGTPALTFAGNYFEKFAAQPGGKLLVAANPQGFVRGFDAGDGRLRFAFQPHDGVISHVAFLPGGERFLTATTLPDGRQALQCWESENGRLCQTFHGGSGEIRALALHPLSGELIVAGHELRVWAAASLPPVRTFRGNNPDPSAVFWGDEDQIFAPTALRGSGVLHSLQGGRTAVIWRPGDARYGQPSVSADGRRVAIGRPPSNSPIFVIERDGRSIRQVASLNPGRRIAHLRLSPKGDRVAVVQSDYAGLGIVDVATNRPAVTLDVPDMKRFNDVAWLEGGKYLAGLVTTHAPRGAPGSTEKIVLWDTTTGRLVRSVTNASQTSMACVAPDGRRFVEAGADRNIRVRDGTTLVVLREFRAHNGMITALAWHPTRPILATASADLAIRLWNLDEGTRLEELNGPTSPPSVLSFNASGNRLATASRDGVARIWEPRSLAQP
jgi:WD40 repeat protein